MRSKVPGQHKNESMREWVEGGTVANFHSLAYFSFYLD